MSVHYSLNICIAHKIHNIHISNNNTGDEAYHDDVIKSAGLYFKKGVTTIIPETGHVQALTNK